MATFDKVSAGDVLYDVRLKRTGNPTQIPLMWWRVLVVSIDHHNGFAQCSWDGNPVVRYDRRQVERLRCSIPHAIAAKRWMGTTKP